MEKEGLLIEKAKRGDELAFAQLIDLYKSYIFAIILNFIKDYEEVENVAQEVFLQVYTSLPGFENDNFRAWISRIASNKSIDSLRRKRSKVKEETMKETEILVDSLGVYSDNNPESDFFKRKDMEEINKVLNSLPQIYVDVIRKFYFEEKSYEEISKEENISYKTVESRLYRVRNMFKRKWRERL